MNPNDPSYARYGGRGIVMDPAWAADFPLFKKDMGPRPVGMTLERLDTNGPYEKGNCRWATPKEQARNRSNNHLLTYMGKTLTLTEWGERTGIGKVLLRWRLKKGWSLAEALEQPTRIYVKRQTERRAA